MMKDRIKPLIHSGIKEAMPSHISPMLCTLTKEIFQNDDYLYELKLDGYRIISFCYKGTILMHSRSGLNYTKKYPLIEKALKNLKHDLVLDGELVVLNKEGKADFDALQLYNGKVSPITYFVFDVLWIDGFNVMEFPLQKRKEILANLLKGNKVIQNNETFTDGMQLYADVQAKGLEGVVAKRRDSNYLEGDRSNNWYKIPTSIRQEFVIGGWAESDRGRSFRSLLFGAYTKAGEFEWIGRSGGGYKEKEMPTILKQLKSLEINQSPFINKILDTKGATIHYVKPQLVANFSFATWTKSGRIRKPATFLGFRQDKNSKQVVREIPKESETNIENKIKKVPTPSKKKLQTAENSNWRLLENIQVTNEDTFDIGECQIKINDVEREIWKGITKADLIQYYHEVAPYILPHLKDRPLSLHIKPVNAYTEGFYIKDMEGRQPDCAIVFSDNRRHPKKGKRNIIDYLICNNEATLLYMINLGCVDINPWTSTTNDILHPNYIVIDLDPSDDDFSKAITAALATYKVTNRYNLRCFAKTSGKTGIHILIPCIDITFPQARKYAEFLCKEINKEVPGITTTEVTISKRGDKLYLDPNQNDYADTIASVYSVRPGLSPTVSFPVDWKQMKPSLHPSQFTIHNVPKLISGKKDVFKMLSDKNTPIRNTKWLHEISIE